MKKLKLVLLIQIIVVFNLSLGMEMGANAKELEQETANFVNAQARLEYYKQIFGAKSSSSDDSPKNSPKNMSDNEKDSDHIGVIPPVSEDDADVLAPDFPIGPTPQVMQRRPRKPKRNNGPRNQSEELGSDFAKFIKKECPGCTKGQALGLVACIGLALKVGYEYRKHKYEKPKTI